MNRKNMESTSYIDLINAAKNIGKLKMKREKQILARQESLTAITLRTEPHEKISRSLQKRYNPRTDYLALHKNEEKFRYDSTNTEDISLLNSVLCGRLTMNSLPRMRSRVVRIFISSTFSDMVEERNHLMADVYPRLRSYLREKHGLEFQAVDMRWGITDQCVNEHAIVEICVNEIKQCKMTSVGPNFVIFLGQRYGTTALPAKLPSNVFESIRTQVEIRCQLEKAETSQDDLALLNFWFKKDYNSTKGEYILMPISETLGMGNWRDWNATQSRLENILYVGSSMAFLEGHIDKITNDYFRSSVTELEIIEGFRVNNTQSEMDNNVIVFLRDVVDLYDYLNRKEAGKFINLQGDGKHIDDRKLERMRMLRQDIIGEKVSKANITLNHIEWVDPTGVNSSCVQHAQYLKKMGEQFYQQIIQKVERNLDRQRSINDELYEEVIQHWTLAKERCETFKGRKEILDKLKHYLVIDVNNCKPYILYGNSGNGKTSIVAKAAQLSTVWSSKEKTNTIIRFCGTTPGSSNINQMLRGISHQLAFVLGKYRHQIPSEFKALKRYFHHVVSQYDQSNLTILMLDGIDQLSVSDGAHLLDWFPPKLPRNFKIVVSVLATQSEFLDRLRFKISNESNFLLVGDLTGPLCSNILKDWLCQDERTLTMEQQAMVDKAFDSCSSPLFLKLIFEEVKLWKSFTKVQQSCMATSISQCINNLFQRLEDKHGKLLVSHSLAYITASQGGVSEAELEDILSLDDTALNNTFVYWEPSIRRLPANLWSRIRHDILHYLPERECDNVDVIYWYHRQFIKAARTRYLSEQNIREYIHGIMADYYIGKWSGDLEKPYENPKSQKVCTAVRYVPEQPLEFKTHVVQRFNLRKLNQLPFHLVKSGRLDDLKDLVYFNYTWLHTKLQATSIHHVLADFNLLNDHRDVTLVADALRMAENALSQDVNVLSVELSGRLLPHVKKFSNIRKLISRCRKEGIQHCAFVPLWQTYQSPGGPLQYICEAGPGIKPKDVCLAQSQSSIYFIAKGVHGKCLRLWDITLGESKPDLEIAVKSAIYSSACGTYISVVTHHSLLLSYGLEGGDLMSEVNLGSMVIKNVSIGSQYAAVVPSHGSGPIVIDITSQRVMSTLSYGSEVALVTADDTHLICNFGHCIAIHVLPSMERLGIFQCEGIAQKIAVMRNPRVLYILVEFKKVYVIHKADSRAGYIEPLVNDSSIKDIILSHTQRYLLVQGSLHMYLFLTKTNQLHTRIQKLPKNLVERHAHIKGAGFTQDDNFIIGIKHNSLIVWKIDGTPIKLLRSSTSTIEKLFTAHVANKVITLNADNRIEVWNIDNLDADVRPSSSLVKGQVKALSIAKDGNLMICAGSMKNEIKVFNVKTGELYLSLNHDSISKLQIKTAYMSPKGFISVTCSVVENEDANIHGQEWKKLYSYARLWDMSNGKLLYELDHCRFVKFHREDNFIILIAQDTCSINLWPEIKYIVHIFSRLTKETVLVPLPWGHIVGQPVITVGGEFLVIAVKEPTSIKSLSTKSITLNYEICIHVYNLHLGGSLQSLSLKDLGSYMIKTGDSILDIRSTVENILLVVFATKPVELNLRENGCLDRSQTVPKGAIFYHVKNRTTLAKVKAFLNPLSDVESLIEVKPGQLILDDKYNVFDILTNRILFNMSHMGEVVERQTVHPILNGGYLVALKKNMREVLLYKVGSFDSQACCFVHGKANNLGIGSDDRTIFIGCNDGRVVILEVVIYNEAPSLKKTGVQ